VSDIASKSFNGVDLADYGLVTPSVSGMFDLAGEEVARVFTDGRDIPNDVSVRATLVPVKWRCVVVGTDHADLLDKLALLRPLLSPRLGWCPMTVENRPFQRTFARCLGFPVSLDSLPYQTSVVEFDLSFERYPYWEDDEDQIVNLTGSSLTLDYQGDLPAYPVYTCTATDDLPNGLAFSVGGMSFTYIGSMVSGDVLVVSTDPPDVVLNGVRDFGHTHVDSSFPAFAVGENVIAKLTTDFDLALAYRARTE
jgi:hypothetical protein